ncbi:hypothetical protein TUM4438_34350 [Shewanella sairae]|uniref:Uncharacterized protein n=1 Tax=Shewanella sairae TaxID=190310 RepID=A0ABQ4PPK4_9GAMM|nr:hypothetical protein [Shewanella sairae]MCL1131935.1 hypothetical protein [Shewanella sairae]GIU49843.1 hypothetical protein TUM4438_34350 [Shewanella sairae]
MKSDKVSAEDTLNDTDFDALLSELNRKRIRSCIFVIGMVVGLVTGFYGARWIYQLWF